jgi:hypothetical protein
MFPLFLLVSPFVALLHLSFISIDVTVHFIVLGSRFISPMLRRCLAILCKDSRMKISLAARCCSIPRAANFNPSGTSKPRALPKLSMAHVIN